MDTKICRTCEIEQSLDAYYLRADSKEGRRSECKSCTRRRVRSYKEANPEKVREYHRAYREANRDEQLEQQRRRREQVRRAWAEGELEPATGPLRCSTCHEEKDVDQFYPNRNFKSGYFPSCRSCNQERLRQSKRTTRAEALRVYGGDHPRCQCCGTDVEDHLVFSLIGGGGTELRREEGIPRMVAWLRSQGYPSDFYILCHCCAQVIGAYGLCSCTRPEVGTLATAVTHAQVKYRRMRLELLTAYSRTGKVECEVCGLDEQAKLCLHFLHQDASEQLRQRGFQSLTQFYWHLKWDGFPDRDRYAVRCANHVVVVGDEVMAELDPEPATV